jgi:hypothetical protein
MGTLDFLCVKSEPGVRMMMGWKWKLNTPGGCMYSTEGIAYNIARLSRPPIKASHSSPTGSRPPCKTYFRRSNLRERNRLIRMGLMKNWKSPSCNSTSKWIISSVWRLLTPWQSVKDCHCLWLFHIHSTLFMSTSSGMRQILWNDKVVNNNELMIK